MRFAGTVALAQLDVGAATSARWTFHGARGVRMGSESDDYLVGYAGVRMHPHGMPTITALPVDPPVTSLDEAPMLLPVPTLPGSPRPYTRDRVRARGA